jgi:DNA-binding ferritin-like protein
MDKLATKLREAQLYAHACHNTVSGSNFIELHEFLGELYGAYESAYDSVVERIIAKNDESPGLLTMNVKAAESAAEWPMSQSEMLSCLLDMEADIRSICEGYRSDKEISIGTQNLIAGIADDSEVRSYKLGQLTK